MAIACVQAVIKIETFGARNSRKLAPNGQCVGYTRPCTVICMTPNDPSSATEQPSIVEPKNADAVIQALGNLARAQERGMPQYVLDQLQVQVIEAAGPDGVQLAKAA